MNFRRMNLNQVVAGVTFGIGVVLGGLASAYFYDKKTVNGDTILSNVKQLFLVSGPIEGSWVELEPVIIDRYEQEQLVYFGGVTRKEDDRLVQYEFIADAKSGALLDLYELA